MTDVARPRVLVVDDEEIVGRLVSTLLTSIGCDVIDVVDSGQAGIDRFQQDKPDLVLLDYLMPGMNGLDALKKIIEIDKKAAVIMLTAVDHSMVVDDCILAGARNYIRKDLAPEELQKRLEAEVAKIIG